MLFTSIEDRTISTYDVDNYQIYKRGLFISVIESQTLMKVNSNCNKDGVYVLDTNRVKDTNGNGVVCPWGRKACKERKMRLNGERSVVDAWNTLQSTLKKIIIVHWEELELKREKEKRKFELRQQIVKKKKIEIKEIAQ